MPFNLGFTELLIILLIVLLVFGAKRLPEMGSAMGKGIREFKKSLREVQNSIEGSDQEQLPPGSSTRAPERQPERSGEPRKLSQ